MTNDERLRMFIDLTAQKRNLQDLLKEIQGQLNELELDILNYFIEEKRNNVTQNGYTIYLKKQIYAKVISDDTDENGQARQRAAYALKDAGDHWSKLVKEDFNTKTLTAALKEWLDDKKPLPESFEGVISVSEVYDVLVRKAGKKD